MGFNCGIVGLPNVGKSTLFNALTATAAAQAANYPFCTIEPNIGRVSVPDIRLQKISAITNSQKIIPNQLEFVDIAGLVKGASKGEGLGNQFLSHIRSTDAIIHVLRCFEDDDITHVEGNVDPIRDLQIIETELMLADLESLEKRIPALEKKIKSQDKDAKAQLEVIKKVLEQLEKGNPAHKTILKPDENIIFQQIQIITSKPILYVCNVGENDAAAGNLHTKKVFEHAKQNSAKAVIISAAIESEVATINDENEQLEFLKSMGLQETGLNRVIREGYNMLELITFFTSGPKETRAWTLKKGLKAPQAAGVIHSDFERGFICAETIAYNDFIECNGESGAKSMGKWRQEGKEYLVQDGDVFHFRFNV